MKAAIVENKYSNVVASKENLKWEKLCGSLSKVEIGEKDGFGWLPADIPVGPRKSSLVKTVSAIVLDVEAVKGGIAPPAVDIMIERLNSLGYGGHLHTTYSHTIEAPRYRIIVLPDRPLQPSELKKAIPELANELGISNCYDTACTDASRLFYLPRCPIDRKHLFEARTIEGTAVDVDQLIAKNPLSNFKCPLAATILPFPQSTAPRTVQNIADVRNALNHISADCDYPLWRDVIWSILSTEWDNAIDIARDWSLTAPEKFDERSFLTVTKSFDPSKGITLRTLNYHAKAGGWSEGNQRFTFTTATDFASLPNLQWRIKGLLPESGLASIFGPSGSGKSFLVLDMLAAIATATDWFGLKVKSCPVVYVALEGTVGVSKRINAWQTHHKVVLPDHFVIVKDRLSLFNQDASAFADAIFDEGLEGGAIVIDTLNQSAPEADENTSSDMGRIIQNAMLLQEKTKGLVILIHHTGKEASRGLRGHSSLKAALDVTIEIKKNEAGREWKIDKSKDGEDGVSHPFRLESVGLGCDTDGDPVTSCVVMCDLFRKKRLKEPTGKNQLAVLNTLRANSTKSGTIACDEAEALANRVLDCGEPRRNKERAKSAIEGLITNGHLTNNGDTYEVSETHAPV